MNGLEQDTALLKELAAFTKLPPSALAREAGLAATTVLRSFNGTSPSRLSAPTIEKLRVRFPDFPSWTQTSLADRRTPFSGFPAERSSDLVELDEIDLRYGLGGTYLDGHITAEKRSFSRALLRHFTHAAPEHLFWTLGDGDSMEPTIRSGELILIDRSQLTPTMGDGIWAAAFGEIGMIKRLRPLPDGTVEIHSDNPQVRPMLASDGDLHVIGRVVAVVRKL